ncbi:MAG: hypothetical protein HOV87_19475 [Catenulispora sp.]|nr:hypothetical protein [Catenulispora sp.]
MAIEDGPARPEEGAYAPDPRLAEAEVARKRVRRRLIIMSMAAAVAVAVAAGIVAVIFATTGSDTSSASATEAPVSFPPMPGNLVLVPGASAGSIPVSSPSVFGSAAIGAEYTATLDNNADVEVFAENLGQMSLSSTDKQYIASGKYIDVVDDVGADFENLGAPTTSTNGTPVTCWLTTGASFETVCMWADAQIFGIAIYPSAVDPTDAMFETEQLDGTVH